MAQMEHVRALHPQRAWQIREETRTLGLRQLGFVLMAGASLRVAIVGGGPAGLFTAHYLLKVRDGEESMERSGMGQARGS